VASRLCEPRVVGGPGVDQQVERAGDITPMDVGEVRRIPVRVDARAGFGLVVGDEQAFAVVTDNSVGHGQAVGPVHVVDALSDDSEGAEGVVATRRRVDSKPIVALAGHDDIPTATRAAGNVGTGQGWPATRGAAQRSQSAWLAAWGVYSLGPSSASW
jgi:hypothetical protein